MAQPHSISEKKVQPSASKRGRYLVPSPLAMLLFRDTVNLKETSQSILLKQASHFLLCRGGFCGSQSSLPSTLIFLHTMETTMQAPEKQGSVCPCACVYVRIRGSCIQAEKCGLAYGFLGGDVVQAKCCVMGTKPEKGSAQQQHTLETRLG